METVNMNEAWADQMVASLVHHGVRTFCIAPGSRSTPLTLACARHPLTDVTVHFDERGLGFYALGCAKGESAPVAIITTSGTATGNLLPAIMEANETNVPLVVLTADRPPELRDTCANQTTDQTNLYGSHVRHFVDMPCPTDQINPSFITTTISNALRQADGPIHINCMFREPLFNTEKERQKAQKSTHTENIFGELSLSPETCHYLNDKCASEKGMIIIGGNATISNEVFKLAEKLKWPILADIESPRRCNHPQVIPHYDLILRTHAKALKADTVLYFGDRVVSKPLMQFLDKERPKHFIHIAKHTKRSDLNHQVTQRVIANPSLALAQMAERVTSHKSGKYLNLWQALGHDIKESIKDLIQDDLSEIYLPYHLSNTLPSGSNLFISNSLPIRDTDALFFPNEDVRTWANRGVSGIDGNIATTIGISKGREAPVIALIGDLAFLHDINSLALLSHHPFPVTFIVVNNAGGGIFANMAIGKKRDVAAPFFIHPHHYNLKNAAYLFDLPYFAPETTESFNSALNQSLSNDHSSIIEVSTDRDANVLLRRKLWNLAKEVKPKTKQLTHK